MGLFSNMKSDGLEKSEDRVGGNFAPFETDLYTGRIKAAFAGASSGGAQSVTLIVKFGDREYRETVYITSKKGDNFYVKDGKKYPLPGFTLIDDLCLVTTDKPLSDQETEDKVVNVYDKDAKKELPKSVPMLVELLDKEVTLAIQKSLENKTELQGNDYVPIADTRETNSIEKVIHTDTGMTVVEIREGAEAAVFGPKWLEKNKGQTRDKRSIKDGQAGTPGKPQQRAVPQPGNSGDAQPKKSLFGNK